MSSCVRSSVAARPGWGFAELEALRVEHDLPVHRFCATVGLPVCTYYDRRARHRDGHPPRGPWPTRSRARPCRRGRRRDGLGVSDVGAPQDRGYIATTASRCPTQPACASYATAASCCPLTTSAGAAISPRPAAKRS